MKKQNPFIEKQEEKTGKDLDHDGEQGEPLKHKQKIAAAANKKTMGATASKKPGKQSMPFPSGGKKATSGKKMGKAMCAACMKANKSSCSH